MISRSLRLGALLRAPRSPAGNSARRSCSSEREDPFAGPIDPEPYVRLDSIGVFNDRLQSQTSLIEPSLLKKHIVLVHPVVKKDPNTSRNTTADLEIAEAKALVDTIGSHWTLCNTLKLKTESERKKLLFGKGNFAIIQETIAKYQRKHSRVAAFFNVNLLTALQQHSLREELGVEVYDRYMLVLLIFKQHARTKEAKLQTSLAELLYYRQRLRFYGSDEALVPLSQRENFIKRELDSIQMHRRQLRGKRQALQLPTVAVVGYTNAGKTSLIKKFTDSEKLVPLNQLFATLDVTCHEGYLPRLSKVIYVDTVGFISDIPTQLIASFRATLEDALVADQLAHVFDVSHPDLERQCETVMETLQGIETSAKLMGTIVHVGNKVDLVDDADLMMSRAERIFGRSAVAASAQTGQGVRSVLQDLEDSLITNTGRGLVRIRCPIGGEAYAEIFRKSSSVENTIVCDTDMGFYIMEVILTPAALSKLRAKFASNPEVTFM